MGDSPTGAWAQSPHCAPGKQAAGRAQGRAGAGAGATGRAEWVRVSPDTPPSTGMVTLGTGGAGKMGIPWHCSCRVRCPRPLQPFFLQALHRPKSAALGVGRGAPVGAALPVSQPCQLWCPQENCSHVELGSWWQEVLGSDLALKLADLTLCLSFSTCSSSPLPSSRAVTWPGCSWCKPAAAALAVCRVPTLAGDCWR